MAYGTKYYFEFKDTVLHPGPATWRIQIDQKDYTGVSSLLPFMDSNPLTLERSAEDENKLSCFVGSKAVLRLVYDGVSIVPHPRVFKDIQEDTMLVSVFKDNVLNFKGFIKPDGAQYPLDISPIAYEINATDYINGFKSRSINLNADGKFFYGFISLSDFIKRTVFEAANYTGVSLNMMCRITPSVTSDAVSLFEKLYLHTDTFYTLEDGADSVYDALYKFLRSFRARLFFSAGTYWIQRIPDTFGLVPQLHKIDNSGAAGSIVSYTEAQQYKTIPSSDVYMLEGTGNVRTSPAIYSQKATYKLKALNKLTNFKWDVLHDTDFDIGVPEDWVPGSGEVELGDVARGGTGTVDDPYYMITKNSHGNKPLGYMVQSVSGLKAGQYLQLDLRGAMYYTTGIRFWVTIFGFSGVPGGISTYYLQSDGTWSTDSGTEILITGDKKTRTGSMSITSKAIPTNPDNTALTLSIKFFYVKPADDPEDPVPSGEVPRNWIYPVFLRAFNNLIGSVESNTVSSLVYSNTPSDENLTFLDMADSNISNCIYYDSSGTKIPIPQNNWKDQDTTEVKSLDSWAGNAILDEFNVVSNVLEIEVISNTLEFHQTIKQPNIDDGVRLVQLSDSYDVKDGQHKIVAEQVYAKDTGVGTYTTKSILK